MKGVARVERSSRRAGRLPLMSLPPHELIRIECDLIVRGSGNGGRWGGGGDRVQMCLSDGRDLLEAAFANWLAICRSRIRWVGRMGDGARDRAGGTDYERALGKTRGRNQGHRSRGGRATSGKSRKACAVSGRSPGRISPAKDVRRRILRRRNVGLGSIHSGMSRTTPKKTWLTHWSALKKTTIF